MSKESLIQNVLTATENVQRHWKALLTHELSAEDVSLSQFWALSVIEREGVVSSRKLGELLHITPGAVTQLVDSLVADYVIRQPHPDDRRITNLTLSPEGKKKCRVLQRKREGIFMAVFAALSDVELAAMLTHQQKILAQLETLNS